MKCDYGFNGFIIIIKNKMCSKVYSILHHWHSDSGLLTEDRGTSTLLCAKPSALGKTLLTVGIIVELFLSSEDYF